MKRSLKYENLTNSKIHFSKNPDFGFSKSEKRQFRNIEWLQILPDQEDALNNP